MIARNNIAYAIWKAIKCSIIAIIESTAWNQIYCLERDLENYDITTCMILIDIILSFSSLSVSYIFIYCQNTDGVNTPFIEIRNLISGKQWWPRRYTILKQPSEVQAPCSISRNRGPSALLPLWDLHESDVRYICIQFKLSHDPNSQKAFNILGGLGGSCSIRPGSESQLITPLEWLFP